MQTAKSSSNDNITMPITFLLTDNTTKSYQTIFNDGFYQVSLILFFKFMCLLN